MKTDAVDVRCLADHQAAMVDSRLKPADIITHDEQDVGFTGWCLSEGGKGYCG